MTELEHLQFDIAMGLKKAKDSQEDRERIAKVVAAHLMLCLWKKGEPPPAH